LNYDPGTPAATIDAIRNGENANIMAGVTTVDAELIGGWHNPNAVPIMILLSDGNCTLAKTEHQMHKWVMAITSSGNTKLANPMEHRAG
jgi:hypothetical protein